MTTAALAMPVALKAAFVTRVASGPRLDGPALRSFRMAQVSTARKAVVIPTTKARLARSGQRISPITCPTWNRHCRPYSSPPAR